MHGTFAFCAEHFKIFRKPFSTIKNNFGECKNPMDVKGALNFGPLVVKKQNRMLFEAEHCFVCASALCDYG